MKLVCSFRGSTIDMLNMCLCAWHEYIKYIQYILCIHSHRLVFYISESITSIAIYHGFFETVSSPVLHSPNTFEEPVSIGDQLQQMKSMEPTQYV